MSVHRTAVLSIAVNRGRLIVGSTVAQATRVMLQRFCGPDGRHEGLVYWAGRKCDHDALVLCGIVVACSHGPQHVIAPPREIGRVSRRARAMGLALVAQVHSHPGSDTRHSDGDDRLVLMPHEGLFSLVVACYGDGSVLPKEGAGLHQYQDGGWVQIAAECADAMVLVPPLSQV